MSLHQLRTCWCLLMPESSLKLPAFNQVYFKSTLCHRELSLRCKRCSFLRPLFYLAFVLLPLPNASVPSHLLRLHECREPRGSTFFLSSHLILLSLSVSRCVCVLQVRSGVLLGANGENRFIWKTVTRAVLAGHHGNRPPGNRAGGGALSWQKSPLTWTHRWHNFTFCRFNQRSTQWRTAQTRMHTK